MTRDDSDASSPQARLVLGLGNPGARYRETRHNVGFRVVDELAGRWGVGFDREECRTRLAVGRRALLAKPHTYMNRSGHAARCLVELYGFAAEEILVVYDEVALPLGSLRLRPRGGPGGHRGMESILESLRTDRIPRLRLGIAAEERALPADDLVDYVLAPFEGGEVESVAAMVTRAADACESWLEHGVEATMNEFNG